MASKGAKKPTGKQLDPIAKFTPEDWFVKGLLFPDASFEEFEIKKWTRRRYGNYEEASRIATEQSNDPDFLETTDIETLPKDHRPRHAEKLAKEEKRKRRLMKEAGGDAGEPSTKKAKTADPEDERQGTSKDGKTLAAVDSKTKGKSEKSM